MRKVDAVVGTDQVDLSNHLAKTIVDTLSLISNRNPILDRNSVSQERVTSGEVTR